LVKKALIAARYNDVDIKVDVVEKAKGGYNLGHPLKKVPVLKAGDAAIFESNSIARFVARSNGDPAKLFGANEFEEGLIEGWIDFAANEIDLPLKAWLGPIKGSIPNDVAATKKATGDVRKVLDGLNVYLANKTFLVRDRLTLADIVVATSLLPAYVLVFDAGFRKAFAHTNRWFLTCVNQPHFAAVLGAVTLCVKKAVAPAPEKKEAPKKSEPPKVEKPKPVEEEAPKPKAKKPFEGYPESKFDMDAFKICYSHEDTRSVALPYFYEKWDKPNWTLWFAEYKYPEDLQRLFMVSNLLGGFCQRTEHLRKHVVGSFLIFGEENNYEIHGAILLRGSEWPEEEMSDIPDVPSFKFTKIDMENPEEKEFFEDLWAWDGKFKGKTFTEAGKIMK
jgi:elongation factor 1-gamma